MRIEYIVVFGLLINVAGAVPYVIDTLAGKTQPNRVTYLLWTLIPTIAIAVSWAEGVTWALVPVLSAALIPFIIFLSSFFNPQAYWKLRKFDYICGALSVVAVLLWIVTSNPEAAILFALIAEVFALLPTLTKLWHHPQTETAITYLTGFISGTTGLFVLREWTVIEAAFPLYIFVATGLLFFVAYRNKIFS